MINIYASSEMLRQFIKMDNIVKYNKAVFMLSN